MRAYCSGENREDIFSLFAEIIRKEDFAALPEVSKG